MLGYSYPELLFQFIRADRYTPEQFLKVQDRKLKKIVGYARKHSPFFAELYKDLPENFTIKDLPVVNKKMMMENYDSYVTDPKVRMAELKAFIDDKSNIGKDYLGKYLVATTSGSTGVPSVVLHDGNSTRSAAILSGARFMKLKFPLAAFCVDDVFLIENGNIRNNVRKMPMLKNSLKLINAKDPYEKICREINEIQPKVVIGYAGSIELLADQALKGNIHIKPVQVLTSGEFLTPETRAKLKRAFPDSDIQAIYGCTEGNVMAYECSCGHMHISDDFYIIEPVDKDNNPVPDGVISDKILLTYFSNFVQPIIRFEMTDRIKMSHEPCPCGRPGAWFEVEGRSNDILHMTKADGSMADIAPLPFIFVIEPLEGINNFQLVLHKGNSIELRIDFIAGFDQDAVFEHAKSEIIKYLKKFGVESVNVKLSDTGPQRSPRTGKFRQMYQED